MSTKEKIQYFNSTKNKEVRADLAYAVSLVGEKNVAIDCGCGAGADIAFLRKNNFTVHAFDIEDEAMSLCRARFKNDNGVFLYQDSFSSFVYPEASLVVADASLFFCPPSEFETVWKNIGHSLEAENGIFCGSFLGPDDTMAGSSYDKSAFWPEVMVFTEDALHEIFTGFSIHQWTEHKLSGETAEGKPHDWHLFSVVAKKLTLK